MSDTATIPPALTPQGWRDVQHNYAWLPQSDAPEQVMRRAADFASDAAQEGKLHRAAALALYGQPFGFTHEDLDAIRRATYRYGFCNRTESCAGCDDCNGPYARLKSLVDRLAALLPPANA